MAGGGKRGPVTTSELARAVALMRAPSARTHRHIEGALTKELLVRDEDVRVTHGFDSMEYARGYLESDLFTWKVAPGLKPLWAADPGKIPTSASTLWHRHKNPMPRRSQGIT